MTIAVIIVRESKELKEETDKKNREEKRRRSLTASKQKKPTKKSVKKGTSFYFWWWFNSFLVFHSFKKFRIKFIFGCVVIIENTLIFLIYEYYRKTFLLIIDV